MKQSKIKEYVSPPVKLNEIDIDTYEYKIFSLDDGSKFLNKLFIQENIPGATNIEKCQRAFKIIKIIKKHKLTTEKLTPVKLRLLLEDLGPTFVKLGQILSKRQEILPKIYCQELDKLCSDSNVMTYDIVSSIIEKELGKSINEIFKSFKRDPIGSASIGQVHRATLLNGQEVVVKVQRPDIDTIMRQDIMLFNTLIKPLKLAPGLGGVDLHKLLDDLWKITQQELNFFVEAINTIKFKNSMIKYDNITCPTIYKEYTTSKVLTMEFIDGFNIKDFKKYNIDGKELGSRLAHNYISQVLNEEFFHADPHQGNIIIRQKENDFEIVWIDFGMVYHIQKDEQSALKKMITAITQRDTNSLIFALMSLTTTTKEINYAKLYTDVDYLVCKYSSVNLASINIGVMLSDILNAVKANGLQLSSTINILARGLVTVEGVITSLTNELSLMDILKDIVFENMFETNNIKQIVSENMQNAITSVLKGLELPALANDVLRSTLRGQVMLNLNVDNTNTIISEFKHSISDVCLTLIICSLILCSGILCIAKAGPIIGGISIYSIIITVLVVLLCIVLFIKKVCRHIK